ncbi:Bug family tripartite tricarboxylate transporter substrate binding protein [Halomonas cupida]|nr:tripartite tricarboxylate transporter substrate binding protein [Halomonas cupida]SHL69822.1 putative tricarboxylic transport membrane protein [Halomonas cupida]
MTRMKWVGKTAMSGVLCLAVFSGSASAWEPERNVEFIVPYSAGGGSDINARMLVEVIRQNDFVDQTILVNNRPGGSGAVGNSYTFNKRGDDHTIMTFNGGQMMSMVTNDADVQLEDLTPLGTLALDTLLLGVAADSDIENVDELVEQAKQDPGSVTIGGAGRGGEDHLAFAMLNSSLGADFQYVPFGGTGEVTSALLGGHIDAAVYKLGSRMDPAQVRSLAALAEERLEAPYDDVPTFAELGHPDIKLMIFRGYAGPPDMPAEAVAYWEGVLEKASESEQWNNDYIDKNNLIGTFVGAEESAEFYSEEKARYTEKFKEVGIIE